MTKIMDFFNKVFGFDPTTIPLRIEIMAGFTTTVLTTAIATILMAIIARLPIAQAPSMCLNVFFAFTLCMIMGYTWQQALSLLLVESIIFLYRIGNSAYSDTR